MTTIEFTEPALLDELSEIVTEMLDGIMEASIPDGFVQPVSSHQGKTAEASVEVLGADPCRLTVRIPATLAIGLAAALMGDDPSELGEEDACAVLAELSNVLGGSVKSLIEEETSLGIPVSIVKDNSEFDVLRDSVFVDHQLGSFQVRLGL